MAFFLMETFPLWWILLAVVVLRSLRSASNHDERVESSADAYEASLESSHHNLISRGQAA